MLRRVIKIVAGRLDVQETDELVLASYLGLLPHPLSLLKELQVNWLRQSKLHFGNSFDSKNVFCNWS